MLAIRMETAIPPIRGLLTSTYHGIKIWSYETTITLDKDVYESALHLARTSGEGLGKVI